MKLHWCASCGAPVNRGVVTAGGVVFHASCFRRRLEVCGDVLGPEERMGRVLGSE